ncbi:MAG TPA: sigma-70 family RNA polymerase sigma factor [Thermoleophilaceae bacterium]|jgi:RNA polymerase primary sigma factor|nr:sigma-70 family RNA polymerase sigma factor [Thermoleophilaceae bacterium]
MSSASCGRQPLTAAEEVGLAKRIERGDLNAKREMIECNLGLVYAVARPYRGRGVPFDDLVQEGMIGLVRAVEKFDHRRGLKFSTYAVWWIRRSLINAIGAELTIRIPASAAHHCARIQRTEDELRRTSPGAVTDQAIAEKTGLCVRTVAALRGAARVTTSLDEIAGKDGSPLGDLIADPAAISAWEHSAELENQRQVRRMLAALPAKHRQVLVRRFGLDGTEAQSHEQIARWLGVGEERSRQVEREALRWLRELRGGRECAGLAA